MFLLHRHAPAGKEPVMVAVDDGTGNVRIAAAPDSYHADVVVPALRDGAEGATPEEATHLMDTLVDRYSADFRMEVTDGNSAGLIRKAEVLFRKWDKSK